MIVSTGSRIDEMPLSTLRRVFRGEAQTVQGQRLIPFNYDHADPLRQAFDRRVLGLKPAEVGRYWIDRRIRGQGMAPRTVRSSSLLHAVVARLPGAIGYLWATEPLHAVKALRIDGKAPTDPGYPLD